MLLCLLLQFDRFAALGSRYIFNRLLLQIIWVYELLSCLSLSINLNNLICLYQLIDFRTLLEFLQVFELHRLIYKQFLQLPHFHFCAFQSLLQSFIFLFYFVWVIWLWTVGVSGGSVGTFVAGNMVKFGFRSSLQSNSPYITLIILILFWFHKPNSIL